MTEHVIDIVDYDYGMLRDEFCEQLIRASKNELSSLPFIRNTLPSMSLVQVGEKFQVFVIGGTRGEVATIRADININTILSYQVYSELTKFKTVNEFLDFIDRHTDTSTRVIGINFGFAMTPVVGSMGTLDGIMVGDDTKDHEFWGLLGQKVGMTVEAYFKAKYGRKLLVTVANDAVCLAALARVSTNDATTLAGIVGTGYNLAFSLDTDTMVNVQACEFTTQWSTAIGRQLYKAEVSGSELYKRYNELIADLGLYGSIRSTKELAVLVENVKTKEGAIARALFKRSAALVAAHLSGFYNFKKCPNRLSVLMQGGMFWGTPGYVDMTTSVLDDLGIPQGTFAFKRLCRADILGIAQIVRGASFD